MDLKQIKADRDNGVIISRCTWDAVLDRAIELEADSLPAAPLPQPQADLDEVGDDVLSEAAEILDSLIGSIEEHGNYSQEATLTFLRQIKQCLDEAPTRDAASLPQQGEGSISDHAIVHAFNANGHPCDGGYVMFINEREVIQAGQALLTSARLARTAAPSEAVKQRLSELEVMAGSRQITAAQLFTQMRQLVNSKSAPSEPLLVARIKRYKQAFGCTIAEAKVIVERDGDLNAEKIEFLAPAPSESQAIPTDLSKRLRAMLMSPHAPNGREVSEALKAAADEIDRYCKDAERYRFLRDQPWSFDSPELAQIIQLQQNSFWDAAIDAALTKKGQP